MKRRFLVFFLLTALLLSGCREMSSGEDPADPEPAGPIVLDTLTVEFAAEGGPALLPALNRLPDVFQAALAEAGIEVGTVQMTLAPSQDAAAQAVGEGSVDLSFLSAEAFVRAERGGIPLLSDGEDGQAGQSGLLCTGPSAYGQSLPKEKLPSWEELSHARWGVLTEDSDLGNRFVSLWLADHYEGNTLSDLPEVTVYESYEALLRAAAREEVDLFPATQAALDDLVEAWQMETTRSDSRGYQGFGRELPLNEEIRSLAPLERCCRRLAVSRESSETLASAAFQTALAQAAKALEKNEDWQNLAGSVSYVPAADGDLDPLRRLLTLEGT